MYVQYEMFARTGVNPIYFMFGRQLLDHSLYLCIRANKAKWTFCTIVIDLNHAALCGAVPCRAVMCCALSCAM
jgi:hypothetical protein